MTVKCPKCHGTGIDVNSGAPYETDPKCPYCEGKGKLNKADAEMFFR